MATSTLFAPMRLIRLTLLALFAASCVELYSPPSDYRLDHLPGTVVLRVGDAVVADGVRFEFEAVSHDSRCPIDAMCVWPGNAVVRLVAGPEEGDGPAVEVTLNTGMEPRSVDVFGLRVRLTGLGPAPLGGKTIPQRRYLAELDLRPAPLNLP